MNTKFKTIVLKPILLLALFFYQNLFAAQDTSFHIQWNHDPGTGLYTFTALPYSNDPSLYDMYHFIWILEGKYIEFGPSVTYQFRRPVSDYNSEPVILRYKKRYEDTNDPGDERLAQGDLAPHFPPSSFNQTTEPLRFELSRLPRAGNQNGCPSFQSLLRITTGHPNNAVLLRVTTEGPATWHTPSLSCQACPNWDSDGFPQEDPGARMVAHPDILDTEKWFLCEGSGAGGGFSALRSDVLLPLYTTSNASQGDQVKVHVQELVLDREIASRFGQGEKTLNYLGDFNALRTAMDTLPVQTQTYPVVNSWDPNTKIAQPNSEVAPGDSIVYTILFENTGPAWESDVCIGDTLHPFLNPHIRFEDASHPLNLPPGEVVPEVGPGFEWCIQGLGPGKTGFVRFKAEVSNRIAQGGRIPNVATIRFLDANQVLATDSVVHTFPTATGSDPNVSGVGVCWIKWINDWWWLLPLVLTVLMGIWLWRNRRQPQHQHQ